MTVDSNQSQRTTSSHYALTGNGASLNMCRFIAVSGLLFFVDHMSFLSVSQKFSSGQCACRCQSTLVIVVQFLSHVSSFSDPMDYSLPGSSVHGIFQPRILVWAAISFTGSFPLRDQTHVSCIDRVSSLPLSHRGSPHMSAAPYRFADSDLVVS